jgi:ribose 5-phosphate isomerase A
MGERSEPHSKSDLKAEIARAAVTALVRDGQRLGLGTGSTALEVIRRVGAEVAAGRLSGLTVVPTSRQVQIACWELGLSPVGLSDPSVRGEVDVLIDGADEVDPAWRLTKGGGAALLTEKIVAAAAARYAIVVDAGKLVDRLGTRHPVPIEVVPDALAVAERALVRLGLQGTVRDAVRKAGPVITDHGNLIIDVQPADAFEPEAVERELATVPGVVCVGIFTRPVDDLFVGRNETDVTRYRPGEDAHAERR